MPNDIIKRFHQDGFLQLKEFVTGPDLQQLRSVYDEIVTELVGCAPHELSGATPFEHHLIERAPPPQYAKRLRQTSFFLAPRQLVAQLAGVAESSLLPGWRLFFKLGGYEQTFWHQDAAYRPPPHDSISVWCTLDDATVQSSCMHYLRGSHHMGLHKHQRRHGHLMATNVNTKAAVALPLRAGGAIAHHCRTLHYASPNQTDKPRRALVLVCGNALLLP